MKSVIIDRPSKYNCSKCWKLEAATVKLLALSLSIEYQNNITYGPGNCKQRDVHAAPVGVTSIW